jgi:glycosyltransferase involved in cell wall biosynthesis
VKIVGQAINPEIFFFKTNLTQKLVSGVHIGRFDPSKRIELIIQECNKIRLMGYQISLTQIGNPSSQKFSEYRDKTLRSANLCNQAGWITIQESIPRERLPKILQEMDFFIHAFDGSLDKTLIEATMCGLPVVTTNAEYLQEFGSWNADSSSSLSEQFRFIYRMERPELVKELFRRRALCIEKHSSIHWQREVSRLLLCS